MTHLFQIREDDLAKLEQSLPVLMDVLMPILHHNRLARTHIRRVQRVLMDVRWNYGPPSEVETISCGGQGMSEQTIVEQLCSDIVDFEHVPPGLQHCIAEWIEEDRKDVAHATSLTLAAKEGAGT